jgi:23S rRNA (adenine2503-C2)-methyltransferase
MPINKTTGVDELLRACVRYFKSTGRRVTYEYALIDSVNDTQHHAEMLSKKLKNSGSLLNLILLNDIEDRVYNASLPENMSLFTSILKKNGVNYTIRRRLGADIDAACGQLRAKREFIWNNGE